MRLSDASTGVHEEVGRCLHLSASCVETRPALAWSAGTVRPESKLRPEALSLGTMRQMDYCEHPWEGS